MARAKVSRFHIQRIYKHIPYETANLYFSCSRNIVSRLHSLSRKPSSALRFSTLKKCFVHISGITCFYGFFVKKKGKIINLLSTFSFWIAFNV